MAAGAAEVQFSEAKASAIDRLINGEVPAAVVLAPRDVADLFPEVEGFGRFGSRCRSRRGFSEGSADERPVRR